MLPEDFVWLLSTDRYWEHYPQMNPEGYSVKQLFIIPLIYTMITKIPDKSAEHPILRLYSVH